MEHCDNEEALGALLDAFGSSFSLEEIASAYCKVDGNIHMVGAKLADLRGQRSCPDVSASLDGSSENPGCRVLSSFQSESNSIHERMPEHKKENISTHKKNSKRSKSSNVSVSAGSVSSVLGKGYSRSLASRNGPSEPTKPVKMVFRSPLAEGPGIDANGHSYAPRSEALNNKDLEDFMFAMLGNGYHLEMDIIRDVLCCCGYDAKKGVEALLNISPANLSRHNDDIKRLANAFSASGNHFQTPASSERHDPVPENKIVLESLNDKKKSDHAMEILDSWYTRFSEIPDEPAKRKPIVRKVRSGSRTVVSGPLNSIEHAAPLIVEGPTLADAGEEEDRYQLLRKSFKANWDAMKAYYEEALDAFLNGDKTRASYLLKQGKYYQKLAREVDEESAETILETSKPDSSTEVTLDLHEQHVKEAIHLLKLNLSSFCGIPYIQYLKVIVEANGDDVTRGARRRWVIKLLDRESIKWSEGENPGTIRIKVDEIDPGSLSFRNMR